MSENANGDAIAQPSVDPYTQECHMSKLAKLQRLVLERSDEAGPRIRVVVGPRAGGKGQGLKLLKAAERQQWRRPS